MSERAVDYPGNYACDLARKLAQRGRNWHAVQSRDLAEHYAEGNLEIILEFSAGADHSICHFVFSAIPYHGGDAVECLSTSQVECNQKVIPSWVRLERPKQRQDFVRQTLGVVTYGVFKFSSHARNREVDRFGFRAYELDFVGTANAIRVQLDRSHVGVFFEEGIGPSFKCTNVLLCPSDAKAGLRADFGAEPQHMD